MANLSITAANVLYVSGPLIEDAQSGGAFTTGDCVYLAADGTWLKAQCDGTAVEAGSNNIAMALFTSAATGARGTLAGPGAIVTVGTGTAGIIYCPARTAGSYMPSADGASTDKITVAAVGIGSSQLQLARVYNSGSVIA